MMASFGAQVANLAAKIQKIPTKTRLIGFGVFALIVVGVFIYFVHIPMTTQIKGLEKNVSDLRATIKEHDERIKKLDELKAEVKGLQERLSVLTKQLPSDTEVSGLLGEIQNLVSKSGLTLKLWRPGKKKTASNGLYDEIPISLDLSGGYHDLALFFDRVSKLTRIVNMLDLKMSGAVMNKAGGMDIKINCTAMTFAAVEKKPDEAPAAKKISK
jgi:type IV pilus assembly protein PilO